jgi:hypothetical protein
MSKMIGEEKASPEALEKMQDYVKKSPSTRWCAYQNHALDSANCGHLQFLAVGPDNTFKEAPEKYPADTSSGMGWRYLHVGWVDLETGKVVADE